MRLFIALDIPDDIRSRIARFLDEMRNHAPDVRWVKPESLHVTLKFLGEVEENRLAEIEARLQTVSASRISFTLKDTGFFPTPTSARVFWIGVEAPPALALLAGAVDAALTPLGFESEIRAFSPHLTIARAGSGAPSRQKGDRANLRFAPLQTVLQKAPQPDFGTITAGEFFLFQSRLSPQGASYSKLMRFPLERTA